MGGSPGSVQDEVGYASSLQMAAKPKNFIVAFDLFLRLSFNHTTRLALNMLYRSKH